MLINVTFELTDEVRRVMACAPDVTMTLDGMITRDSAIQLIRNLISQWNLNARGFVAPKEVTVQELDDYKDAIEYWKALGQSDLQIKRWCFKQRARRDAMNKLLARARGTHV